MPCDGTKVRRLLKVLLLAAWLRYQHQCHGMDGWMDGWGEDRTDRLEDGGGGLVGSRYGRMAS